MWGAETIGTITHNCTNYWLRKLFLPGPTTGVQLRSFLNTGDGNAARNAQSKDLKANGI
jgi:hypothetical protein